MNRIIHGNMAGCYSPIGKTFIIEDADGNTITGVVTENEVVFTAGDNDVREGSVYASDKGVSVGTKDIPSYHTSTGRKLVKSGAKFIIPLEHYDYTELQLMICKYNTSLTNSFAVDRVGIENSIYPVESTVALSTITKDDNTSSVNLGITNNTENKFVIRYFTYKEIEYYDYNFAEIDPTDNMCIGILTTTSPNQDPEIYVPIATYDDEYVEKYYDWGTGKWYYDQEMSSEWIPPEA